MMMMGRGQRRWDNMPPNGGTVLAFLAWPKTIAATVVIGVAGLGIFGFGITTPGERWDKHQTDHVAINVAIIEMDYHFVERKMVLDAVVLGECIENPIENLERQRLIEKCRELGIER